jgi:hypothetical protein
MKLTAGEWSGTMSNALRDPGRNQDDRNDRDGLAYQGKLYGAGRWRKRKGLVDVRLRNGEVVTGILRYEAGNIGKREFKIKRLL